GFLAVGHRLEEAADLVGHLDQDLEMHRSPHLPMVSTPRACASSSSCRSVNALYSRCHSEGCATLVTCAAVTLYSGQLVAQSEESVVMTFAPDSGKWKVV